MKDYTIIGYYEGTGQLFTEWAQGKSAIDATATKCLAMIKEADGDLASVDINIVEVIEGRHVSEAITESVCTADEIFDLASA